MKKRTAIISHMKTSIVQERRKHILILTIFLGGLLLGSITSVCASAETTQEMQLYFNRFFSAYMIQGTAKSEAFRLSLVNYLQFALWIWASGWFIWLLPLGFFQCMLKGFRTGFTITYLIQCYPLKGILLNAIAILPQNLLFLPALCFYLVSQIQFATDRKLIRKGGISRVLKNQIYGHHSIMTVIFLSALLLCALIEGYIVPTLLQPLCGFFL